MADSHRNVKKNGMVLHILPQRIIKWVPAFLRFPISKSLFLNLSLPKIAEDVDKAM